MEMEPGLTDLEMGFEPQQRARSNTWPLPRPEILPEIKCEPGLNDVGDQKTGVIGGLAPGVLPGSAAAAAAALKKNSSRRNAWGNLSYADLITQAIGSSPNKRLTLSQIYEWMVHNVAYFKDKGDSNSSAGWKNSIRHNLSLHNRFMRVQNEGTGKSSWWMLNPDAKPGKSARRRATSMETSKFEKRRGRVKKKVEDLRRGLEATPSPSSSISESLDLFPESPPIHGFQLSPDFRPRASSNASSCGGRLSPIPSGGEGDWVTPAGASAVFYGPEQLAGSLEQTMRLGQEAVGPHPPGFAYPPPPPPPPYRPAPPYTAPPSHRHPLHNHTQPPPIKREYNSDSPSPPASTFMGQMMSALNPAVLDDLNINIETIGPFDCNVDEVIKHELSLDGTLDFNFTGQQTPSGQDQTPFSGHSWVH